MDGIGVAFSAAWRPARSRTTSTFSRRPGARRVPLAFAAILAGALLLVSGYTGSSLGSVLRGHPDHSKHGTGGTQAPASGAKGVTGAVSAPGHGTSWRATLEAIAKGKHWSIQDWLAVVNLESSGNPASVNPSSGAFGLGQALGATGQEYPKMMSHNGATQIEGMAEYIEKRYGTPSAALEHEHSFGWY